MYIARLGGLAAALGIGAALVAGAGRACADSSAEPPKTKTESPQTATDSAKPDSADPTSAPKPRPKKRPSVDAPAAAPKLTTLPTTIPKPPSHQETAAPPTQLADTSTPAPTPALTVAPAPPKPALNLTSASTVAPVTATVTAKIVAPANPVTKPAASTTVTVSTVASALFSPFAGGAPTTPPPVDPPAAWTMLAAARREIAPPSAIAPSSAIASPSETAPPTITPTPPFAFLQQLPIIGPMLITPIVAFIHQIPLIGDVLHPWIGYPIQLGLPAGTPTAQDVQVQSFDGTWIYVHFFPAYGLAAGQTAPTVLDGPGLGLPGSTDLNGPTDEFLPTDVIGIAPLRQAGYNVVTWDPRGEWYSGGTLEIDSPNFEAKDVSTIINWLATQPDVALNSPGDPKLGMVGGSYGGGIQLVTAATDPRVDAIVPTIAWHSLNTSLYKDAAFKSSWGTLLTLALVATLARTDPAIYPAAIMGDLTGVISPADQQLLSDRGPGDLVNRITAPTMLVQGTVDTLFTLAEADANAKALIANGVDTKVLWFCGGHGDCLSSVNNGALINERTLEWLDRYVKGDTAVTTGPQFEFVDQNGKYFSSDTYPVKPGTPIEASSAGGVLPLLPILGGSGPQLGVIWTGPINALLGIPSAAPAINALNLTIPASDTTRYVVGAPQLTLTYSGTGGSTHVYAQLVDDTSGLVLGNLVTPVPVTLDGQQHTLTIPMEMVAQTLAPGQTVTLQVVASAFPYETIWTSGVLNVSGMELTLPTADPAAITAET